MYIHNIQFWHLQLDSKTHQILTSSVFTKSCSQADYCLQSKEDGAEDPASVPGGFWDDFLEPALIRLNENFMVLTI